MHRARQKFGGSAADWAGRIKLHPRDGKFAQSDLIIDIDDSVIVIELNKDLSDDARLALLDLDVEAPALRGHRLTWDKQVQAWVPADLNDGKKVQQRPPVPAGWAAPGSGDR